MNKNLCSLAWIHTSTDPFGFCRSCCIAKNSISQDGRRMNIATDSINDIMNSEQMQQLRQDMRNETYPSNCDICWNDERNGKESKRMFYNALSESLGFTPDYDSDIAVPVDLQINIGNVCNLKCRTCSSYASSKWAKETKDRGLKTYNMSADQNDYETSEFWLTLDTWSATTQRLEIMGGEPMYSKEFKELIERLIANGHSKHISLNWSSNGTIYDEELVTKIKGNFKNIGINISLDGIGKHFDYIRHGMPWETVDKNIKSFFAHLKKHDGRGFGMSFTITISPLNIYYLHEIHEYLSQYEYKSTHIWNNIVYYPEFYDIRNLPTHAKQAIIEQISNKDWDKEHYARDIEPLLTHLKQPASLDHFKAFIQETKAADTYRKESFVDTFPEVYELIKEYWNE